MIFFSSGGADIVIRLKFIGNLLVNKIMQIYACIAKIHSYKESTRNIFLVLKISNRRRSMATLNEQSKLKNELELVDFFMKKGICKEKYKAQFRARKVIEARKRKVN